MSKRKLTKLQQTRIKQQQEQATVTASGQHAIVTANRGKTVIIEDQAQQTFICNIRQNIDTLVCGDHVIWQQQDETTGVVLALEPRTNYLARPDRRGQAKVVAANIDQLMIVSAVKPALNTRLIDRYLLAAELSDITPLIVFNKIDLPDKIKMNDFQEQLSIYTELGYQVVFTSAKQDKGISDLQSILVDKISVFVGHSGVGKS